MGFIENHFFFKNNKKSPPTSLRIANVSTMESPPLTKRKSSRFFLKVIPNQSDAFLEGKQRCRGSYEEEEEDILNSINPASYTSDDELESVSSMMATSPTSSMVVTPRNKTTKTGNKKKKSVSFANVEIRQHEVILGDHPCCTIGLPISLGWTIIDERVMPLSDFEQSKQELRLLDGGRRRGELRLSFEERRIMLQDYSEQDVRRVSRKLFRERRCSNTTTRKNEQFFAVTLDTPTASV